MTVIQENRLDIPQNTILGRNDSGTGDWEVLQPVDLARIMFAHKAKPSGATFHAAVNGSAPAAATGIIAANTLRAYPWDFDYPTTVDRISAIITTAGAAGSQARVALYTNLATGYPATKTASTELLLNGTLLTEQTLTFPSLELYGRVWVVTNGSVALAARSIPIVGMPTLGVAAGLANNSQRTALSIAGTFASGLPTTFPAGATLLTNTPGLLVSLRVP